MKILLIEDEKGLSDALCRTFENAHYTAEARYDGASGLDEALTGTYDAVVLDVMLPKKDGFTVLRELRAAELSTPVLMLTARGELEDRVAGLDAGADYYLTKPFETAELLACLRVITRNPGETAQDEPSFGDLSLSASQGGITCLTNGRFVKMGPKELQLIELLIRAGGSILSREFLTERIWGFDDESEYNKIEVYVSFVRRKISFIGSGVRIAATRGIGYSLEFADHAS